MYQKNKLKLAAKYIKETRIKNNISIKDLSVKSKLSVYKIKKIESGNYDFTIKDFNKLSAVLDIDLLIKKQI